MIQRNSKSSKVETSPRRAPKAAGEGGTPPDREFRRTPHGDIFVAGSVVRESGIYEVLHDLNHRTAHEVVMIAQDLFPACEICDNRVRYRVLRTAPYIFSDEDFEDTGN